jgi:hypothetical protein
LLSVFNDSYPRPNHAIDIYETGNYSISSNGIRKVKEYGVLGDIVCQVIEDA